MPITVERIEKPRRSGKTTRVLCERIRTLLLKSQYNAVLVFADDWCSAMRIAMHTGMLLGLDNERVAHRFLVTCALPGDQMDSLVEQFFTEQTSIAIAGGDKTNMHIHVLADETIACDSTRMAQCVDSYTWIGTPVNCAARN